MKRYFAASVVFFQFFAHCFALDTADVKSICEESGKDCKTCIAAHPSCSWCGEIIADVLSIPATRCGINSEIKNTCLKPGGNMSDSITNPSSHFILERNDPFTDVGSDFFETESNTGISLVQMRPQNITIKLRKGEAIKFNVTFRKVVDFPLDIYYAMDLSNSMDDDLAQLQKSGSSLFDNIRLNVTKNVQLGFGSFVDKVVNPFTSTEPDILKNPCKSSNETDNSTCAPPFGFRHQLSVTGNSSAFVETLKKTEISGNVDAPEGSFDALMQIAVCEHIGWRDGSTRVVLLTTDDTPHFAMDGRVAAILEANDMKCHLEKGADSNYPEDTVYTKSKVMDYPSLGQLREVFKENKIHCIFAVTEEFFALYKDIETFLPNSYVVKLANDSNNIEAVIGQTYNKIKERMNAAVTTAPDYVQLNHRVFCPGRGPSDNGEMLCDGIKNGDEIVFEFEVSATQCPENPAQRDKIILSSSSVQDEVILNIEYLCQCDDCYVETNSSYCNYKGTMECGMCNCNEGEFGSLCQCPDEFDENSCKFPGSELPCGDHGLCECGQCVRCNPPYNGTHCECQTEGCATDGDKLCGGPDKGWCNNCPNSNATKCVCNGQYSVKNGTDGPCTCHPDRCKKQSSNDICSGRGRCDCDTCVCDETDIWSGKYCDSCKHPSCTGVNYFCNGTEIERCAECKYGNGECSDLCSTSTSIIYYTVKTFPDCSQTCPTTSTSVGCKQCPKHTSIKNECKKTRSDDCTYQYQIVWTNLYQFQVYVKEAEDADCPEPPSAAAIATPIAVVTLVIGILTIVLWKYFTNKKDKENYEAFVKELRKGKWQNAASGIYQEPVIKIRNPAYMGDGAAD